jgi:hypothetical protein
MISLCSAHHVSFMFSDLFFLLSHAYYVIYISSVLHSKTVHLYRPPVSVLLVSSLGINLISSSLSPLVPSIAPDTHPPFCSPSQDVLIGVMLVHCCTHLPQVGPIVDPLSLNQHGI